MNGRTNSSDVTVTEVIVQEGVSIPLEAPTSFSGTSGDGTATITWTDPVNKYADPGGELVSDWSHDIVVRKQGSAPSSPSDGVQVLQTTSRDQVASEPYVDSGLTNDQEYYYGIYAYNQFGLESEALIGSVTPTRFYSVAYARRINLAEGLCCGGYNGSFAICVEYEDAYEMGISTNAEVINSLLVKSTAKWPTGPDTEYTIWPQSSVRLGNKCIFFSWGDNTTVVYDGNLTQSLLTGMLFNNAGSFISSASVDNSIAYVFANQQCTYPNTCVNRGYKIDSNLVVSGISKLPQSTSWKGVSLSSPNYAMIGGISKSSGAGGSTNYDYNYFFDTNGTRQRVSTPLCLGNDIATSLCDEYMLIYGGSEQANSRVDSNHVYAISSDLVSSDIYEMDGPGTFAPYDIQTTGLGITMSKRPGSIYDDFHHFDKRLTYQGKISGTPSNISVTYDPTQCTKAGNYVLIANKGSNSVYAFENT